MKKIEFNTAVPMNVLSKSIAFGTAAPMKMLSKRIGIRHCSTDENAVKEKPHLMLQYR